MSDAIGKVKAGSCLHVSWLVVAYGRLIATRSTVYGSEGIYRKAGTCTAGNGIDMRVRKPFSYEDSNSHSLTAKPGFITDGASIPRAHRGQDAKRRRLTLRSCGED